MNHRDGSLLHRNYWVQGLFCLAALFMAGMAQAQSLSPAPSGNAKVSISSLPPGAQAAISASVGRDQPAYQAQPGSRGYEISNARGDLGASFTPAGVTFSRNGSTWRLALEGWGSGSKIEPALAAAPRSAANRIEYVRGPLTEWYVNGPLGLEQGFTLNQRPAAPCREHIKSGCSELTVALRLSGDLTAAADANQTGLTLTGRDGRARLRYTGLTARDADGKPLSARMEVAGSRLLLKVDDRNARYPVTIDPWVQTAKLVASDGAAGEALGISVAVSGNTVVATSLVTYTNGASTVTPGGAYVFQITGETATQVAKLTASDGTSNDQFGISVGISGNTIVVGAPLATFNNTTDAAGAGAAYVFVEPAGGWNDMTQTAKLTSSDGVAGTDEIVGDEFGESVAISGNTIVVGASAATVNVANKTLGPGAAYVFVEPSGGWTGTVASPLHQTAKLTAANVASGEEFGSVVRIGGSNILVEGEAAIGSNSEAGVVYLFVEPSGGWSTMTQTSELTTSGSVSPVTYEQALAIDGNTAVVGAEWATVGSTENEGSAYVFQISGDSATQVATLTPSDGIQGDCFGVSVAVSGNTVVVGACGFTNASPEPAPGAAYVYQEPAGGWTNMTETQKLSASDAAPMDQFGSEVAIGSGTIVVGAPAAIVDGNSSEGAAYVFLPTGSNTPQISFTAEPGNTTVPYGTQVTLTATVTGSGTTPTGTVSFNSNGVSVGSEPLSSGVAQLVTPSLPVGSDSLTAGYSGDINYSPVTSSAQSLTVTQGSQTITFANPGPQPLGTPFTLVATASSGLTVTFISQTTSVCTASLTTATFATTGTCTIQATQAGNADWAAAPPVTQSFFVGNAQTITFNNPGAQTVGTPLTLSATASSGLPVSFNSQTPSVCTVSGVTATFIAAGNCTIQATQAGNSVYAPAAPVPQSFTVTANAAVITNLSPAFATAGGAAFTLTVSGNGFAANSQVHWGATSLATAYVNQASLTAQVSAADISTAGIISVTVQTPSPSGSTSNALQFEVDSGGSGTGPAFTTATATVVPGSTATYPVTLSASATDVSAQCLNLPAGATCSYSATAGTLTISTTSATPAGSYQVTAIFTETLPGAASSLILLPFLLLPLAAAKRKWTKRQVWLLAVLAIGIVAGAASSGCGGGNSGAGGGGGTGGGGSTPQTHTVTSSGTVTLVIS